MTQNEPRNLITTTMLHHILCDLNGLSESPEKPGAIMPTQPSLRSGSVADVALVVGGGGDPLAEYAAARMMCETAEKTVATFVANDTLTIFPDVVDYACTLHPDKMAGWLHERHKRGLPMPYGQTWCHRSFLGFTNHTRDWQGSSGLFMTKIALEQGWTHVILCGVPMTVEGDHIIRHQPWNAAGGFIRGWQRHMREIRANVRSMSGWTQEQLGAPEYLWLVSKMPRALLRPEHFNGRA